MDTVTHPDYQSTEPLTWTYIFKNRSVAPFDESLKIVNLMPFSDIPFVIVAAIIIYSIRRILARCVYRPLALHWKLKRDDSVAIQRFCENAWFSTYYPAMTLFGLYVLSQTPWFWDTTHFFIGYPHEHTGYQSFCFREYYLIGGAFYIQALFTLIFIDERMKDFMEMIVHHVATIVLIVFSMTTCHHRYGSMILLLHDAVDIFLYSAKMFHGVNFQLLANVNFFLFTLTFAILRLGYFPYLISITLWHNYQHLFPNMHYLARYVPNAYYPFELSNYGLCVNRYCLSSYWLLVSLMSVLLILHCYWFCLIVRLLVRTIASGGNVPGDIREKKSEKQQQYEAMVVGARASGSTNKPQGTIDEDSKKKPSPTANS